MTNPLKKGDYVLATKFSDGNPADNWCVGFYDRKETFGSTNHPDVRHFVVDGDGKQRAIRTAFGALTRGEAQCLRCWGRRARLYRRLNFNLKAQ